MQIHLVDGTYELFRAYYGGEPVTSPTGREVGATQTLARSLLSLVRNEGATHVAVAYDHVIESFRNQLYSGYKTGDGIDPLLWGQAELAERMTGALGFVVWPMVEFEADDALAAGAARYAKDPRVERVAICSPDKDLAQCVVDDRVVLVDRRRKLTLDASAVLEKYGVPPASIPDWLALVGDAADGFPGIPRWGAKSAAAVLTVHPHLEQIPDAPSQWSAKVRGAATLAENLASMRKEAELFRVLATLRTDVPLAESVDDLEWRGADRKVLTELCAELGDEDLLERVPKFAGE